MQKEIRTLSKDGKTVQITLADERWYIRTADDGTVTEYPSVTWIAEHYPKGIGFYKWLANHGWDESQSLKEAAGNRGTKVHRSISDLLLGNTVAMDAKYPNADTGELEELGLEEWEALMSFTEWHKNVSPKMLQNEYVVFNEDHKYAGTADFICEIEGERWLIDFKTSQNIWPSHEIQLAAYSHALPKNLQPQKLAILQLGYKRNKAGFKFTEIEDQFDLFLAAHLIWQKECSTQTMFQKDFPTSLSLS